MPDGVSSSGHVCRCEPWVNLQRRGQRVPSPAWRVLYRECNYYCGHYRPSRFSKLTCLKCNATWRTKQAYVASVPDVKEGEWL